VCREAPSLITPSKSPWGCGLSGLTIVAESATGLGTSALVPPSIGLAEVAGKSEGWRSGYLPPGAVEMSRALPRRRRTGFPAAL